MKKTIFFLLSLSLSSFALDNGDQAPAFELKGHPKNIKSKNILQESKYMVIEWYNDGCPFVRKHYDSQNIPKLQKKYKDRVNWVVVNSSAEGKQGHIANLEKATELYSKEQMSSLSLLMDNNGDVGQAYGAKTTPHFFIVDPTGKIVYQGAIDSIPSAYKEDIAKADNYVSQALDEVLAGKKVTTAKTRPYGCSVKY